MKKTKTLIKMAKEIHEENNDFEAVARTFETLKTLCDEFLQTPYEGAMLVMRGNIKPEKKYVLYVVVLMIMEMMQYGVLRVLMNTAKIY